DRIQPLATRGTRFEVMEGYGAENVALLKFPSYDEALAWCRSDAYQAAVPHRQSVARFRAFVRVGADRHDVRLDAPPAAACLTGGLRAGRIPDWLIIAALVLAEITSAFEVSMIFAAMPRFVRVFGDPLAAGWILTGCLLVSSVAAALCARLG